MLLTVEYKPVGGEVEIYADSGGLERLISILSALRKRSTPDHEHLMTPAWAGQELTEEKQGDGTELLNHLKIVFRPEARVTL